MDIMTTDKLFSECFVLCDIIYVGCQYLSSCDIFKDTMPPSFEEILILIGFQPFWSNKQNGEVLKTNHCLQENYFALHYYEMGRTPKYYVYTISRKNISFYHFCGKIIQTIPEKTSW